MRVEDLLIRCRYEILPLRSLGVALLPAIDPAVSYTVTCSPTHGIEATLSTVEQLRARGARVIPHIAARHVVDAAHLREIVTTLETAGVSDVFVPAGDVPEPAGVFDSSLSLLQALDGIGHGLERIGVAAYPEGHPFLDDEVLTKALLAKRHFASYMVTQMCFRPERVAHWLRQIRSRGVDLELHIGVPGVISRKRLIATALKIGVRDALSFVRKQPGLLGRLIGPSVYSPDSLVHGLAASLPDEPGISGLHVFTFNEVLATQHWRSMVLEVEATRAEGEA